ncbi:MAG: hypothetical protein H7175_25660, partial [Burkholderiales bacterium]|nr:hypothetical protein [Anaerolineae bacterium]
GLVTVDGNPVPPGYTILALMGPDGKVTGSWSAPRRLTRGELVRLSTLENVSPNMLHYLIDVPLTEQIPPFDEALAAALEAAGSGEDGAGGTNGGGSSGSNNSSGTGSDTTGSDGTDTTGGGIDTTGGGTDTTGGGTDTTGGGTDTTGGGTDTTGGDEPLDGLPPGMRPA